MSNQEFNAVLKKVNDVVFSNSLDISQKYYGDWSKSYDKNMKVLGLSCSPETGEMFAKHGKNCKVMLDIGAGNKNLCSCWRKFVEFTYSYLNKITLNQITILKMVKLTFATINCIKPFCLF